MDTTISLDDGLSLQLGEHSYIHRQKIRNPSGALTHITIGKFCSIATDLTIIGYDHHHEWITMYPFLDDCYRVNWPGTNGIPYPQEARFGSNKSRGDITIGNDVWIGYNTKLFKGITIGNGAVVGACSLVNKSVEPFTIVAGTPARPIRKRFTDAEIATLERICWWDWPPELINQYMPFLCSSRISDLEKFVDLDPKIRRLKAGLNADATALPRAAAPCANGNGHKPAATTNGARPAPVLIQPEDRGRSELRQFNANATEFFADVVPPQLTERHLRNSRIVPSREHILHLMPKGGVCAEVGTQTGSFAKLILSIMQPARFHIYDINFTPFDHAHFASDIEEGVVQLHKGDSSSLLGEMPDRSFDFIYVDGDHSYKGVAKDLEQAARKIKDDGWIVCKDYTIYSPLEKIKYGVYRAVNELCLNRGFETHYLGLHPWGYHDVALKKLPT